MTEKVIFYCQIHTNVKICVNNVHIYDIYYMHKMSQ